VTGLRHGTASLFPLRLSFVGSVRTWFKVAEDSLRDQSPCSRSRKSPRFLIMRFPSLMVIASVLLSACASNSVQQIGTVSYAPLLESSEVVVFTSESQIKEPYEVVGIISYDNPGKFRVMSLGDAIEPLKEKAREVGANGIIIDKSQPIKSGIISTGIYAEARAIRLKTRKN
jgi:hypothetical protein